MSDLIDDLIEAARLLGATQAKKGIGCYTREDARFERAMHESISDNAKRLTAERDELRRQLDPMGEYTSADELIAALRAEKAEDEAMKLDAQRYRWLRPRFFAADFAYSDPPVCAIVFRWPKSAKISANLDRDIDAAMGASNE